MSTTAEGTETVVVEGQKVAEGIHFSGKNLYKREGSLRLDSVVVIKKEGEPIFIKDNDATAKVQLEWLKNKIYNGLTFEQIFKALCEMSDDVWAENVVAPVVEEYSE